MKYTFKDGFSVEGTLEQIYKVAKTVKETVDVSKVEGLTEESVPNGWYLSAKDGLVEISSMNEMHIRNALMKRTSSYLDAVKKKSKVLDNKSFMKAFTSLTEDKVIVQLFEALDSRS